MSFSGDASQVPVSHILQALFMNGQEGILTISDGSRRRNLRLLKVGLRPLAASPTEPDLLRYALVKEKLLTDAEFNNALSTWDPRSRYPGDFLVRRRLISREQVETQVRRQLEEVIFDVFCSPNLRYEFVSGDDWQDHELFHPDGLGQSLIYSVNGILMESVRREDDWRRIHEVIASEHEVYAPVGRSLPTRRPESVNIADSIYESVAKLVTGDRTVAQIVAESPHSPYEVHHLLFQLKSAGLIRALELAEKERLADKLRRMLKTTETIGLYQSILADDPDHLDARLQLIALLERVKQDPALLVENYAVAAEIFEGKDTDRAAELYAKILALHPDRLDIYERLIRLYYAATRPEAALAAVRTLAKAVKADGRQAEGAEVLIRVHHAHPHETLVIQEIADLLVSCGERQLALEYLRTLARLYERLGDTVKHRKTCRLIVNLSPSDAPGLRSALGSPMARPTLGAAVRTVLLTLAIVGVLATGIFFGLAEFSSRKLFAEIERSVDRYISRSEYDDARVAIKEFERAYPYSTKRRDATRLLDDVDSAEHAQGERQRAELEKTRMRVISALGKARNLMQKGDWIQASSLLEAVRKEIGPGPLAPPLARAMERLEAVRKEIARDFDAANEVLAQAEELEKQGEIARAHAITLELLQRYPHTPAARDVTVPVLVRSRPESARIFVDDRLIGERTPLVAKLSPFSPVVFRIAHPAYREHRVRIDPRASPEFLVYLEKQAVWQHKTGGPVDAKPLPVGDEIYVPTRNGSVVALIDGREKWAFSVPDKADITGGLCLWNNLLYGGCFDGKVYVINATTGQQHGEAIRATRKDLWIKEAPSEATAKGVFAVNCADRTLAGIDLSTMSRTWSQTPPTGLVGSPRMIEDRVLVFTPSGQVLRFDGNTGDPLPPISLDGSASFHGEIAGDFIFVALDQRVLQVTAISDGRAVWRKILDSRITAPPTVSLDSSRIIVPLENHLLACFDSQTGDEQWRKPIEAPIETQGVIFRGRLFIGTTTGRITCRDVARGELLWSYETDGASESPPKGIYARGVIHKGMFIQGADDGAIYALLLD